VLALAKAMPIANVAERMGEYDPRLWRVIDYHVGWAVEGLDLIQVAAIAEDET
jgi:hypothetical protein